MVALQTALNSPYVCENVEVTFLFIDERKDRIEHLESEIKSLAIPQNFHIHTEIDQFDNTLSSILDDIEHDRQRLVPTFAFVDPFGFKGVPFSLIQSLLNNPKTEVFINVMTDSINRFKEHPNLSVRQHIIDLLGTNQIDHVIQAPDCVKELRRLYFSKLEEQAQFVRFFEMCDEQDRPIYHLFFATNHRLGHVKMKEAFWRVDTQGGFRFTDHSNPQQPVLFTIDPAENLARIIHLEYRGEKKPVNEIILFIEDETAYISRHARTALKLLEEKGEIIVEPVKADGKNEEKVHFLITS